MRLSGCFQALDEGLLFGFRGKVSSGFRNLRNLKNQFS